VAWSAIGIASFAAGCSPVVRTEPLPIVDMVEVPAGSFLMGSDDGPPSSRPARLIFLDAFAIERTEVTTAAFLDYLAASGQSSDTVSTEAGMPAAGVVWRKADGYCRWAGRRLPTEAEWEKAARGTDARRYPWGMDWDPDLTNTAETGSGGTMPPGSFPEGASPYGLLDMSGNVAEWVADTFDPAYYLVAPRANPLGPVEVLDHSLRGGSWDSPAEQATTFFRDSSHSVTPNNRVGFRCAGPAPAS
jgi:formylglycine-generating enzyme required for sulfatase activity